MQICGVFVAVIVVVAKLPKTAGYIIVRLRNGSQNLVLISRCLCIHC